MAKTNGTVSIEELRRVLSYDPDTGELKWTRKDLRQVDTTTRSANMKITFKFIGLTFEADVVVGEDYEMEFTYLTHEGTDASFLAMSTLQENLEDAAFDALAAMERRVAEDIAADQIAYKSF